MSPYCWLLLVPSLYTCVICSDPCGKVKYVVGEESGNVLLQVDQEGVTDISWLFRTNHIATTEPRQPVKIMNRQFKHRLYNGTNGSLNITKLAKDDQGEFVASVRTENERECNQVYNLTVFSKLSHDDIKIHHNVTQSGACIMTLTCSVKKADASVAWTNSMSGIVEKTPTVQVTEPFINTSWTCTASNPVADVSRTILPLDICQNENNWTVAVVVVTVVILLAAVGIVFLVWRKPKNLCTRIRRNRLTSESVDLQDANIYWEIDASKEVAGKAETTTRKGPQKLESVYVTATHLPVRSVNKGRNVPQSDDLYCD